MPISISGDGTITGVSVGGLPDGIVDTDMLATSAVATAKIANDAVDATKIGSNTFVSYAMICDQKSAATDGGTFTGGAWRTRDLNTEISDADGIVSISSNQFTLGAGSYLIRWSAPAFAVNRHVAKLYDITADTNIAPVGSAEKTNTTSGHVTRSFGVARVTITADNVYEIQHRSQSTRSTDGFGVATDFTTELYTIVEIYKEA